MIKKFIPILLFSFSLTCPLRAITITSVLKKLHMLPAYIPLMINFPHVKAHFFPGTDKAEHLSEAVIQWARNELSKIDELTHKFENIQLKIGREIPSPIFYLANKTIVFMPEIANEIDKALTTLKSDEAPEEEVKRANFILNVWKFMLYHEVSHLINHDIKKSLRYMILLPSLICVVSSTLESKFLPQSDTWKNSGMNMCYYIVAGMVKYRLSNALINKVIIKQEIAADNFACQKLIHDREVIKAAQQYFSSFQKRFDDSLNNATKVQPTTFAEGVFCGIMEKYYQQYQHEATENEAFSEWVNKYPTIKKELYAVLDPTHPMPEERVTMMQKFLDQTDPKNAFE